MKKNLKVTLVLATVVLLAFIFVPRLNRFSRTQRSGIKTEEISTIVLPHLDFPKSQRRQMLNQLSTKISPGRIVILSINHFNAGDSEIQTTPREWNFQNKSPKIDQLLIEQLADAGIARIDDTSFQNEHGIKNVLPDLTNAFPDARFTPIIIKNFTSQDTLDRLLSFIGQSCSDCLMAGSIDFSHYNPDSLAELHDVLSLDALRQKDSTKALQAETDSPEVFYLLAKWSGQHENENFDLFASSNTGKESGSQDLETTSYIMGYYSSAAPRPTTEKATTFLFGGDLMFDRMVNHQFRDIGIKHVFDNFGNRVFWGTDIAFANLEGPISSSPITDDISTDNLTFNFPPETIDALKFLKVNGVSLANNHTLNAGVAGFENTKNVLNRAGIINVGSQNSFSDESIARYDGRIPVSIVAVNFLENPDFSQILSAVRSEKLSGRFVIISPHWGNEYQTVHSSSQQDLAHQLIEAGADMIVGSHPHVVEDVEIYHNKPIVYSLGNFVFDQTFSKDTQVGLLLGGKITDSSLSLSFFPIEQINLQPQLSAGENKQKLIDRILQNPTTNQISGDTINLTRQWI